MTDLIDEVKESFEKTQEEQEGKGAIRFITDSGEELAPAFTAMRSYYEQELLKTARRGYRHFAGSTMPIQADELLKQTATVMLAPSIAHTMRAFTDGILMGHRDEHIVAMRFHFKNPEKLYEDEQFLRLSKNMAVGFNDDDEVREFFAGFVQRGIAHIAHVTGFAHQEVDPVKVWDIWMMADASAVAAAYLSGNKLGTIWRERDVLDGIEIATEENPSEPAGESSTDH